MTEMKGGGGRRRRGRKIQLLDGLEKHKKVLGGK